MVARHMTIKHSIRCLNILQEPQKKCDKTSNAGSLTSVKCVHYSLNTGYIMMSPLLNERDVNVFL